MSTANTYALIRNMNTRSNDKLLLTIKVIKKINFFLFFFNICSKKKNQFEEFLILNIYNHVFPCLGKSVKHTWVTEIVSKVRPSVACVVRGAVPGNIGVSLVR